MIITFARNGQEIGQFPEDEVPALVASGQILPSDDYWHEGLDDWRKAGERWPVAEVAHRPATPVMRMEDAPTSSRSGFGLVFLLIAALLIAGGAYWYFYLRPAPEEPAAVAQPSEEITEPTVAEPTATAAPVEESVDEQAAAPAPAPAPAASEEELALAWLRENPNFQPQTVKLLQPREFTLKRNALVRGSTTMPAGASANVESWDDTTVTAGFAAEPRVLPHAATDFVARVVAVYRQEKDQPAPAVAAAEPTPQEAAPIEPPAAEPAPVEPAPAPAVPTIDKLSVVCWNIEWFPGREPGASNSQAKDHAKTVKKELTKINPDILLAQEIRDWDAFIDLCSAVPDLQVAAVSHYLQGRAVGKQQTAIASKLPVVAAWYDNWKPAEDQPPRGYTAAVVQIPGTENLLLVYSLHLKSNRAKGPQDTKSNYAQREESARQLLAHVKEMEGNAFKERIVGVIVGGDFNTNHDGQFEDETIDILTKAGFANTWDGVSRKRRETWIGGGNYEPTTFDYIMTKGLGSPRADLIDVPEEASDHRPVALEIDLSAR
jgi:endonuclease/exonuclease/phosphatase family metal-dependent hydrolase